MINVVSQAPQLHQTQLQLQPQRQQQNLSIGGAPGQHGMNAAQAAPVKVLSILMSKIIIEKTLAIGR
jgi:hypothetical protein